MRATLAGYYEWVSAVLFPSLVTAMTESLPWNSAQRMLTGEELLVSLHRCNLFHSLLQCFLAELLPKDLSPSLSHFK